MRTGLAEFSRGGIAHQLEWGRTPPMPRVPGVADNDLEEQTRTRKIYTSLLENGRQLAVEVAGATIGVHIAQ